MKWSGPPRTGELGPRASSGSDSGTAAPVRTLCAAAARLCSDIRLSVPTWSPSPHRPQFDSRRAASANASGPSCFSPSITIAYRPSRCGSPTGRPAAAVSSPGLEPVEKHRGEVLAYFTKSVAPAWPVPPVYPIAHPDDSVHHHPSLDIGPEYARLLALTNYRQQRGVITLGQLREIVGGVSQLLQVLPEKDKALRPALLVGIQVADDRGAKLVLRRGTGFQDRVDPLLDVGQRPADELDQELLLAPDVVVDT